MAVAGAGAAVKAVGEAGAVAGAVKSKSPKVRVRGVNSHEKPVFTAMTVILTLSTLRYVLQREKPNRSWFVKMGMLGFGLAALSEINPKLGKYFSYTVMASAIFAQVGDILAGFDALDKQDAAKVKATPGAGPFPPGTTRVSLVDSPEPQMLRPSRLPRSPSKINFSDVQRPRSSPASRTYTT